MSTFHKPARTTVLDVVERMRQLDEAVRELANALHALHPGDTEYAKDQRIAVQLVYREYQKVVDERYEYGTTRVELLHPAPVPSNA